MPKDDENISPERLYATESAGQSVELKVFLVAM